METKGTKPFSKSSIYCFLSHTSERIPYLWVIVRDGKGGNDVITVKNFTTIKGYFGDSIYGKGLVLLPINFSNIDKVTYSNNRINIYNKSGAFISVGKQTSVKTADGLFVTPTKIDDKTGVVTNLHVTKSLSGDVVLDDELDNLRKIDNSNFNITKQLSSANYHSAIGSSSNHIFYPDKEHHNFYWEAPSNISHLYLFDNRNANIMISQANGILDFSQLNSTLNDMPFIEDNKGEIKINKNGLNVTLLPNYKDVTVTFDGEEYYKLQNGELERDYCSHSLRIDGRFSVNGTDLLNHHNCFTFDSDKVLFLKLNNDLLLLSDRGALSISNYYSSVHKNWDLSVGLNNRVIEPEEFGERADGFSSFRYYQPDEQGLQIYHNQPINKNDIGLVDLKDKSILNFDMKVVNDNLLLSYKNNTLMEVENWNTYQPAREMIFAFNDTMVSNSRCIASTCNSEDVVFSFNKERVILLKEQVFYAIVRDNINEAKDLIRKIESLNPDGKHELTPLYLAIKEGRLDIVKILFDRGYFSARDKDINALCWAIHEDRLNIAKFLLDKSTNLEAKDDNGNIPLLLAAQEGKLNILKLLLDNHANINVRGIHGKTTLHFAAQGGNIAIVKLLLDMRSKSTRVDVKDYAQRTPLYFAVQSGNLDAANLLLDRGAKINYKNIISKETLLHAAVESNKPEVIKVFLDRGIDIESKDINGNTPMLLAVQLGNLDAVKLLLENGANIKAADMYGQTPLDLAIKKGYEDIVEVLKQKQLDLDKELLIAAEKGDIEKVRDSIRQGANVNVQDKQGWTPVFWAIQKNNFNIIELLLDNNADIKVKDNEGWTPLHWAVQLGSLDIVERLVKGGADVNASTADGRTPLDIARDKGYNNIVNYLEEELNKEREKPVQRRRRHHHGDHARRHMSRKPLAINSSNQPEIATSSGIRPFSLINYCISLVKSSVGGLLSSKSEGTVSSVSQFDGQFAKASISNSSLTGTTLPFDDTDKRQENGGFFRDNVDYVNANLKRMCERQAPVKFKPKGRNTILEMGDHYLSQVDFNGTITLFDLLIRRFTGQKYISTVDQSISPLEAQGYALNITKGFEKVVEQAGLKSGVSMHRLNIDYMGMQKEIVRKVIRGQFNEISGILKSYIEKACSGGEAGKLSSRKFDKFMLEFNKGLDIVLNQSIEQILHNRDGTLEVDGAKQMSLEPQSYLSNASVQGHSKVLTCLSEIGVTKLGGNLSR